VIFLILRQLEKTLHLHIIHQHELHVVPPLWLAGPAAWPLLG
jgi:hypothetical protein